MAETELATLINPMPTEQFPLVSASSYDLSSPKRLVTQAVVHQHPPEHDKEEELGPVTGIAKPVLGTRSDPRESVQCDFIKADFGMEQTISVE